LLNGREPRPRCRPRGMGASIGGPRKVVEVVPDVDSEICPGRKSVVSVPLSDYADFTQLWISIVKWMKAGRTEPGKSKMVYSTSGLFIVKQMSKRSAFPRVDPRVPGGEDIEIDIITWTNKALKRMRSEVVCHGHVIGREGFYIHEEPLCLEAWGEMPGLRVAGESLCKLIESVMETILQRAKPDVDSQTKIVMHPNIEQPPDSGLFYAVSDPFPEWLTFERVWVEWLDLLKYQPPHEGIKSVKLIVHEEHEFTIKRTVDGRRAAELGAGENRLEDVDDYKRVYATPSSRALFIEHTTNAGETPLRYWITFPADPLHIKTWSERTGARGSGEIFAGYMEAMLNSFLPCEGSLASQLGKGS